MWNKREWMSSTHRLYWICTAFWLEPIGDYLTVRFHFGFVFLVQFPAEIAKCVLDHKVVAVFNVVIVLPLEKLFKETVMMVQFFELIGQLFRFKLPGVYVRIGRSDATVIGSSVHNRQNTVQLRDAEKLFSDVIGANRILKRQIEFVFRFNHLVTFGKLPK